ncbi:phosphorylating glyceraldehyde-3-phosphate dehydrogenase [Acidianus sp. RZ1]|uniref:phosphorylating glyceraldehyde-3-phosphate dehydrogenase n=1 Tax=Acidianus sp. RZ1 TaxID=1540082 RepID=UPI001491A8CD|nr:phosphorylating glyceraldehyde-3-phosphate dehydrogenase [Acidianus sp. RZ1]
MIRVSVNGYGTIGKRVASAILAQPDMKLLGVAKTTPNYEAFTASKLGINLYVPESSIKEFEEVGLKIAGTVEDMVRNSDVVVDATPNGVGAQYKQLYQLSKRKAVFQGGEKSNVADVSFSALCNYSEALNKDYVRVVSCNTTALLRTICSLGKVSKVQKVRGTIVRRAADPKEVKEIPISSLVPNTARVPSHHAKDVNTVLKDLDIVTMAIIAPTTLMHMHLLNVTFSTKVSREDILEVFKNTPRIILIRSKTKVNSTAEILEVARDLGRPRNDIQEVAVFEDSVYTSGNEAFVMYAVHQESIVVPENIDAIRAMTGFNDVDTSIKITNSTLGIRGGYII